MNEQLIRVRSVVRVHPDPPFFLNHPQHWHSNGKKCLIRMQLPLYNLLKSRKKVHNPWLVHGLERSERERIWQLSQIRVAAIPKEFMEPQADYCNPSPWKDFDHQLQKDVQLKSQYHFHNFHSKKILIQFWVLCW